jgi:hydroxymethylpyrimidine/phosphomethylpyrimidine kinase
MTSDPKTAADTPDAAQEPTAPACVMCFNTSDPSGAGGLAGDVATVAAMGAHALPVVTGVVMRDTAEVFDHHALDPEVIVEQARSILEDITLAGWKVGFLGSAESVGAVAEVLSDYTELPLVSYMPSLGWLDEDQLVPYLDAYRELILRPPRCSSATTRRSPISCCPTGTATGRRRRVNWPWPLANTARASCSSPA